MPTTNQPQPGDRVQITAAQSFDVTWDDTGDWIVGLYGTLLQVVQRSIDENIRTGRNDATPYEVRLDEGDTVWAAGIRPETDGLRADLAAAHASRRLNDEISDLRQRLDAAEAASRS